MKRLISIFLVFVICLSVAPGVFASRNTSYENTLAQNLKSLGLFRGVSDTDFDLDRPPTRIEALVMLIRILGKESEAMEGNFRHPFTDVPNWADSYVGYAYQNKLSNGTSGTTFGTGDANAAMYLTFVLRALGYSDSDEKDFVWDNPYPLAEKIGILPAAVNRIKFLRADVVLVSYASLAANIKGTNQSLADKLIKEKVFTKKQFNTYYDPAALENYVPTYQTLTSEEIYEKCSPAVFYIEVYDATGYAKGSGSGFFLDENGTAVTNYHVIEDASSAMITLSSNQKEYKVEGIYDYNKEKDWAILKVEGSGFPSLKIGDDSSIIGGSSVYAIGSPMGLQNTISEGLISNTNRVLDDIPYIQTTAAISHGSSGGALLNKYGEVIGITSAGFTDGENLGLAIPVSLIHGYNTNSLVSLYDMFGNHQTNAPQTPTINNDYSTEAVLKSYIINYYNEDLNDSIAYTERSDYENGYIDNSISLDEDGTLSLIIFCNYSYLDYYFCIDINDPNNSKFVFQSYNSDDNYLINYVDMNANSFRRDMKINFSYEEGDLSYHDISELTTLSLNSCMDFLTSILNELSIVMKPSKPYSIADFGFVNFK